MTVFQIKRNDTKPSLAVQFLDATGSAIDLTNTTAISFNMATNDNSYTSVFSGAAVITGSTTGNVEYQWSLSDTNRSGTYLGEFEATFIDSSVLTLPCTHSLFIKINEDYD